MLASGLLRACFRLASGLLRACFGFALPCHQLAAVEQDCALMPCRDRPGFILASHSVRHRAAWLHPGFTFASPLYTHASALLHFSFGLAPPGYGQADLTSTSLHEETAWQHLASPCFTLADVEKTPGSTLHRQVTAWKRLLLPASPCFSLLQPKSLYFSLSL